MFPSAEEIHAVGAAVAVPDASGKVKAAQVGSMLPTCMHVAHLICLWVCITLFTIAIFNALIFSHLHNC